MGLKFHTLTCKDRVERFIAITLKVNVAYSVEKVRSVSCALSATVARTWIRLASQQADDKRRRFSHCSLIDLLSMLFHISPLVSHGISSRHICATCPP